VREMVAIIECGQRLRRRNPHAERRVLAGDGGDDALHGCPDQKRDWAGCSTPCRRSPSGTARASRHCLRPRDGDVRHSARSAARRQRCAFLCVRTSGNTLQQLLPEDMASQRIRMPTTLRVHRVTGNVNDRGIRASGAEIQAVYLCALPILVRTKRCAAHSAQRS
jgi:hypothetical protein